MCSSFLYHDDVFAAFPYLASILLDGLLLNAVFGLVEAIRRRADCSIIVNGESKHCSESCDDCHSIITE